jgi:hypothetical protein
MNLQNLLQAPCNAELAIDIPDTDIFIFSFILHENAAYLDLNDQKDPQLRNPPSTIATTTTCTSNNDNNNSFSINNSNHSHINSFSRNLQTFVVESTKLSQNFSLLEPSALIVASDLSRTTEIQSEQKAAAGGWGVGCLMELFQGAKPGAVILCLDAGNRLWTRFLTAAAACGWAAETRVRSFPCTNFFQSTCGQ